MIRRLIVKGFRKLRDFDWSPQDGMNILVGDNAAGKSTILDAIELVMSCRLQGRPARTELSPYWFNLQDVDEFFKLINASDQSSIVTPEILIEAYFNDTISGDIRGINNSQKEDATGLQLKISVNPDLEVEFLATCKSNGHQSRSIPTDYYELKWKTFKGDSILKTPKTVSCSRIDSLPRTSLRAIDSYARNAIDETLSDEQVRKVSNKYRDLRQEVDQAILSEMDGGLKLPDQLDSMGFKMDQSPRSDWRNSVVIDFDNVPLPYAGKGNEITTRAHIAMKRSTDKRVLLVEEPESHLSHTSLFELLSLLKDSLCGRQMFVSTHSPFVLNRLGLDKLALVSEGRSPASMTNLSAGTVEYFQRLSGYDTLRIVLARKLVLVEGPSDEMVFKWAYNKRHGRYPEADAIDVMEYGTRGKRALELSSAIGRGKVAVLRDNDETEPAKWLKNASKFTGPGKREMFVGQPEDGTTLEPQMVKANESYIARLASVIGSDATDADSLVEYMTGHKTDWALRLLIDAGGSKTLSAPRYIEDAIDFIARDKTKA
jgi:energy-coupling factor transporter ATP-binding protein EcfA2